jgi:hypothetical protein
MIYGMSKGRFIAFKIILLLGFAVQLTGLEGAEPQKDKAESIFKLIYNFDFEKADSMLKVNELDEEVTELLKTDLLWWKMISVKNETVFRSFLDSLDKREKSVDFWKSSKGKIAYRSYKIRYELAIQQNFNAFFDYLSLKKMLKEERNLPGRHEMSELYNKYIVFLNILENYYFFSRYSKPASSKLLESIVDDCNSSNLITRTLSHYFLFKFYHDVEPDFANAWKHAEQLSEMYPGNFVFRLSFEALNNQFLN